MVSSGHKTKQPVSHFTQSRDGFGGVESRGGTLSSKSCSVALPSVVLSHNHRVVIMRDSGSAAERLRRCFQVVSCHSRTLTHCQEVIHFIPPPTKKKVA